MNRTSLSFRATRRTRSRSLDTPCPALSPGRVSLAVLPSGRPLPPTSAASTALFGGFAGTTSLSDFSRSCIEGIPPKRSPRGPPSAGLPPREPSRTGHHQHLAGDHEISRFSRMELVVRAWDLRPRRATSDSRITPLAVLPSAHWESVGTLNFDGVSRLNNPARTPPVNASLRPHGTPTHDSGPP